ncbi:MAG: hypothetical protein RR426_05455 [Oscillospiraceae bacterium]
MEKSAARYCAKCRYRSRSGQPNLCDYFQATGQTRRGQPCGEGCTFRVLGKSRERGADE